MSVEGSITDQWVHTWLQEIADGSWASLHYDTPALADATYSEIFGGGYTRLKIEWAQPTNRSIWSLNNLRFTGLVAGRLTHYGIWDARSAGTLIAYGPLPTQALIATGGNYGIGAGELAISLG